MYWMLEVRSPKGGSRAVINKLPDLKAISSIGSFDWFSGNKFDFKITEPLVFELGKEGGNLTDFFPSSIPLMSVKMLNAIEQAGVNNIDSYPATLLEASGVPVQEEYRAINIIDRVACADLEASECFMIDPDDPIGIDFDSLVIDEERAKGHNFFRLSEAVNGIVVHDSVREALEPLNLRGITFVAPEDWVG